MTRSFSLEEGRVETWTRWPSTVGWPDGAGDCHEGAAAPGASPTVALSDVGAGGGEPIAGQGWVPATRHAKSTTPWPVAASKPSEPASRAVSLRRAATCAAVRSGTALHASAAPALTR